MLPVTIYSLGNNWQMQIVGSRNFSCSHCLHVGIAYLLEVFAYGQCYENNF